MSSSPYHHAPTQPRPKTDYLPDGAAPASEAEELAVIRGHVPDYVCGGERFAAWVRHWDPVRVAWTKLPLDPRAPGYRARADDGRSWGTLEEAVAFRRRYGADGIARVLVDDEGVLGGDVDHVESPAPEVAPHGCYAELSPGGHGVRFFLRGTFPEPGRQGRKRGDVELYSGGRFLSVTARVLRPEGDVDPAALGAWYRAHFPRRLPPRRRRRRGAVTGSSR